MWAFGCHSPFYRSSVARHSSLRRASVYVPDAHRHLNLDYGLGNLNNFLQFTSAFKVCQFTSLCLSQSPRRAAITRAHNSARRPPFRVKNASERHIIQRKNIRSRRCRHTHSRAQNENSSSAEVCDYCRDQVGKMSISNCEWRGGKGRENSAAGASDVFQFS